MDIQPISFLVGVFTGIVIAIVINTFEQRSRRKAAEITISGLETLKTTLADLQQELERGEETETIEEHRLHTVENKVALLLEENGYEDKLQWTEPKPVLVKKESDKKRG